MPIKSYLAYARPGKKEALCRNLSAFQQCEVLPSQNHELLIIITDTASHEEDEALREKLEQLEYLQQLAMVSGYDES